MIPGKLKCLESNSLDDVQEIKFVRRYSDKMYKRNEDKVQNRIYKNGQLKV